MQYHIPYIYGLGKSVAFKLVQTSHQVFREQADVFRGTNRPKTDVTTAGETALVLLYRGQSGDKLDLLRLQRFHQKVDRSTSCVKPEVLPPASAAAKFHSMHVYLQVRQLWMGKGGLMKTEDWGWYEQDGKYHAVLTDKEAAPAELLEVVRCNCKTGCSTRQCSCRKNGIDCCTGCDQCRGICSNMSVIATEETIDE